MVSVAALREPRCSESNPRASLNPARNPSVGAGRHKTCRQRGLRRSTGGSWHRSKPIPPRRPRCRSARRLPRRHRRSPAHAPANRRGGYPPVFGSSTASSCTPPPGLEEGTNEPDQGIDQSADRPLRSRRPRAALLERDQWSAADRLNRRRARSTLRETRSARLDFGGASSKRRSESPRGA
jgi:hypothetical protein